MTIISVRLDLQLIQNLITLSRGDLVSGRFNMTPSQLTGPKIRGGGGKNILQAGFGGQLRSQIKELLGKKLGQSNECSNFNMPGLYNIELLLCKLDI